MFEQSRAVPQFRFGLFGGPEKGRLVLVDKSLKLMFKVAAVCACLEPLPECKDKFVNWLSRQVCPDRFEYRLQFCLVVRRWGMSLILLKHSSPYIVVERNV
jgi:hypothetical protein